MSRRPLPVDEGGRVVLDQNAYVPSSRSSAAALASPPIAAQNSPEPVDTRATLSSASLGTGGVPASARTLTGRETASTMRRIPSTLSTPGA
jgi:hypothetical protein